MCGILDTVKQTLTSVNASSGKVCPRMIFWSAPLYDIKDLNNLPVSYDDFKKLNSPSISPMCPPKLPDTEMDLTWGTLPTLDDLKKFLDNSIRTSRNKWISIEEKKLVTANTKIGSLRRAAAKMSDQNISNSEVTQRKRLERSAFVTQQGNLVGGGTSVVLDALAAYLRYLEGTARYEWQEVHQKLRETETREGASFGALFGSALFLGIISRRRVYYEAINYEKERNAGFLSPFGYSAISVAAAVDTVCSMEWYWLLALKSQKSVGGICAVRIWRWNGYIIQYAVAGHKGPAVLLVHGFGAFLEHYRDNINRIAEGGKRVWAITLLGFGRSEKPNVVYSELMWSILVRDFIIEVVGEPVHVVGNSIGGYFTAIVAGLWPYLAKSAVLLNSAGNIIPGFSTVNYSDERQTSGAAWFGARLLLLYLRFNIRNIVKNFYPSKPGRVDDWLINEMLRASHDPGVLVVLECIFSLDLSVPLNCLFEGFEKKILVIQGMRDPLSDSKSKLALFRAHCKGITVREIDAGHCPHDEQPLEVNSIIQEWIISVEGDASSGSPARYIQDGKAEFSSA